MGQPELIRSHLGEAQMLALGAALASGLPRAAAQHAFVVYLSGCLGAGKTTLARGLLRALGVRGPVRSPTFTLVETYACADFDVIHIDLYRLDDPAEVDGLGLRDFDRAGVVWLIEWPEKGRGRLPAADLVVTLDEAGAQTRNVALEATGADAKRLLNSEAVAAWSQVV